MAKIHEKKDLKTRIQVGRYREVLKALQLAESPVKMICIQCQVGVQVNRKDKKCLACSTEVAR